MVCYCPLSVLSVPESILNEGQLHLAAIFQLSSRCHGDPVVSWWTCQESVGESGGGGANAARGWGVRGGKTGGPGGCDRRKDSTELSVLRLHLINQPLLKHNLYSSGSTQQTLLHTASQLKFCRSAVDWGPEIITDAFSLLHRLLPCTPWPPHRFTSTLVPTLGDGFRPLNVQRSE